MHQSVTGKWGRERKKRNEKGRKRREGRRRKRATTGGGRWGPRRGKREKGGITNGKNTISFSFSDWQTRLTGNALTDFDKSWLNQIACHYLRTVHTDISTDHLPFEIYIKTLLKIRFIKTIKIYFVSCSFQTMAIYNFDTFQSCQES